MHIRKTGNYFNYDKPIDDVKGKAILLHDWTGFRRSRLPDFMKVGT